MHREPLQYCKVMSDRARRGGRVLVLVLCAAAGIATPARAAEESAHRVDLLTVGPGDDVPSRWGHAALCVTSPGVAREQGICVNYGGGELADPRIVPDLVRGRARFRSGPAPFHLMLRYYQRNDRTVYRQALRLDEAGVRRVRERVRPSTRLRHDAHVYDILADNCTTRVRDLVDLGLGGRLRAATEGRLFARSYRELIVAGLGGQPPLAFLVTLVLGPLVDRAPTVWEAMFLPDVLRAEVAALRREAGDPVALPVEVLAERRAPDPTGSPRAAAAVGYALAVALAIVVVVLGRRPPWGTRIALALGGLVLGILGGLVWLMAGVGATPLLVRNVNVFLLWPTDVALAAFGAVAGRPRLVRMAVAYLGLRVAVALGVLASWLAGLVVTPVLPQVTLVAVTCATAALALAGLPRRAATSAGRRRGKVTTLEGGPV
jgi:hypothetical protein